MSAHQVLAFLELLQSSPGLGGTALAARLEVDPRTIRRYADQLRDLGIPVEAARGRYGGYRLRPGYKIPPLMFSEAEATAVVTGLLAARQLGLAAGDAESALGKVQRVLPVALRESTRAVADTLAFTLPSVSAAAPPDAGVLLTLASAAREHRRVRLGYVSWNGTETERELDPYGMVFHSGRWYAAGFDHRSGEVRTFRIDRVVSARLAPDAFKPVEFDTVQHVTSSLAKVPYQHAVTVRFGVPAEVAHARVPATVGTLTPDGDGVILTARAERLDGMAQMIAGLGWPFEIREPDALRAAVRDLAARLLTGIGEAPQR
ncbi:helix-turn-helix transcriptional regulator [Longispora albida]|uniref:helix-turn-helix transcriptional regulator n=1 Tax=Longispora albida TaxID=203523 RepID=UPI0003676F4F|nr:YafY family protein [Longispora albida]